MLGSLLPLTLVTAHSQHMMDDIAKADIARSFFLGNLEKRMRAKTPNQRSWRRHSARGAVYPSLLYKIF
jgi:hypothetical protein